MKISSCDSTPNHEYNTEHGLALEKEMTELQAYAGNRNLYKDVYTKCQAAIEIKMTELQTYTEDTILYKDIYIKCQATTARRGPSGLGRAAVGLPLLGILYILYIR